MKSRPIELKPISQSMEFLSSTWREQRGRSGGHLPSARSAIAGSLDLGCEVKASYLLLIF